MRFVHLSDLHLGKIVHEFSMLEDQEYILNRILVLIEEELSPKPDAVLISGDVYDRSIAPTEALVLFERFLSRLVSLDIKVFIISGNHDSPERLSYCSSLMSHTGIHISETIGERLDAEEFSLEKAVLRDEFGEVDIYLLPYVNKKTVKAHFPDCEINSWTDALDTLIQASRIDYSRRCVILSHQYIANASLSDSEDHFLGGLDVVNPRVFEGFDYVALGHLHRPQEIPGYSFIRYCGSPLKYSFSESGHQKSMTVLDLFEEKGKIEIQSLPLIPLRDMKVIRGYLDKIVRSDYDVMLNREDYYRIILEDEEHLISPFRRLREVYPNMMLLEYEAGKSRETEKLELRDFKKTGPYELFEDFFRNRSGREMKAEQKNYLRNLIEEIFEEDADETD